MGDKNQLLYVNKIDSKALNENYLKTKFNLKGSSHLLTEVKRQEDGSYILINTISIIEGI